MRGIAALGLLGLGLLGTGCKSESEAFKAYRTFAGAYMDGNMGKAQGMAVGDAAQRLQNQVNPPPGQPYVMPFKERVREVHGVLYEVQSEEAAADGSVSLKVKVKAKIDRPGTHSVNGSEEMAFEHTAHLIKSNADWKIDRFDEKEVAP